MRISWDGDEPWVDTEDLQLFRSSAMTRITPIRIEAMFDGKYDQPKLSDHEGLRVTYKLRWSVRYGPLPAAKIEAPAGLSFDLRVSLRVHSAALAAVLQHVRPA